MSQDPTAVEPQWQTKHQLSGQQFGRLTVLRKAVRKNHWDCLCQCGKQTTVHQQKLLSKHTKSCKCLKYEAGKKHGMFRSYEYRSWLSMISRCYHQSTSGFRSYGARGITVCDRWRFSFELFYKDMGPKPSPDHTIDRISGEKNYEPGNCRWATRKEQGNNTKTCHLITFGGETRNITQWSEFTGIPRHVLYDRLNEQGWDVARSLTTPVEPRTKSK